MVFTNCHESHINLTSNLPDTANHFSLQLSLNIYVRLVLHSLFGDRKSISKLITLRSLQRGKIKLDSNPRSTLAMRYSDLPAGCSATVEVLADEIICPEHSQSDAEQRLQSWIVIKSGQSISLKCSLRISTKAYQVDLLIDGILRNTFVSPRIRGMVRREDITFEHGVCRMGRGLFYGFMKTCELKEDPGTSTYYYYEKESYLHFLFQSRFHRPQ